MIIRAAVTNAALLSGPEVSSDAFQVMLDFVCDHAKLCQTSEEFRELAYHIQNDSPTNRRSMLKEALTHVVRAEVESGIESCTSLDELQALPVDVAILDASRAREVSFDSRDVQVAQRVAIAQVGDIRGCHTIEQLRRKAGQTILRGYDDVRDSLRPLAVESSTIDIFDPYVFDVYTEKLKWKSDIGSFLKDVLSSVQKEVEVNLYCLSDGREKAWSSNGTKSHVDSLLGELQGLRSTVAKVSIFACPGNWRDEKGTRKRARELHHDRFVQFTMRKINKRRVAHLGRGIQTQGAPTSFNYYHSEPRDVMSHLDVVRRVVNLGSHDSRFTGAIHASRRFNP